jgi:hypothetical protein
MCLSSASGRCCIEGLDFLYRCEFVLPKFLFLDAYSGLRGHLDSFVMMQLHSIAIKLGVFIAPLGCHKGTFFSLPIHSNFGSSCAKSICICSAVLHVPFRLCSITTIQTCLRNSSMDPDFLFCSGI